MRFVDEAIIEVAAGDGGNGCVSFLHLRRQPKGGPDGGDGGRGGDVRIVASQRVVTLADHSYLRHFRAGRGAHGQGQDKNGRAGKDKVIEVPVGTLIFNQESGELLADLTRDGQVVVAARGGRGGKGNRHFATSTNRTPRLAQPGEAGESLTLRLELKLLADVGLLGLPNAGKSSLIRVLSRARPKVADYPFTTITPNLGSAQAGHGDPFTIADIPGLVEGSHKGAGLGLKFLRHVERTRLFLFVVDISAADPAGDLATVRAELQAYDPALIQRTGLVVANKIDICPRAGQLLEFRRTVEGLGLEVLAVSALTQEGIPGLLEALADRLGKVHMESGSESE
ncbi:MAG: GTPase ObgE [Desulfarculaceae bacterium]|jgi:GTP-binding protein